MLEKTNIFEVKHGFITYDGEILNSMNNKVIHKKIINEKDTQKLRYI